LADYEKDYHVHLGDEHYHIDIPVVRSVQVEGNTGKDKGRDRGAQRLGGCAARCPVQVGQYSGRQDLDLGSTMFKEVQGSRVPSLTFCGYAQHCVAYSCGYVPFLFTN